MFVLCDDIIGHIFVYLEDGDKFIFSLANKIMYGIYGNAHKKHIITKSMYESQISIQYIHEYFGHILTSRTIDNLAKYGNLEVLKWFRNAGCTWTHLTCAFAAKGGHLDVLKYAIENKCQDYKKYEHMIEDGFATSHHICDHIFYIKPYDP